MARIAIVGTRESGKTVLMTVLAKRYQNRNGDAPFLKTMNLQTMAFTEKNWHRLTVERDWPPLTPPGDLLKLHWSLEHEGQPHEIQLVDFAGETFRYIFGQHNLTDSKVREQLAAVPSFKQLLDYLDGADVVVLLVNLRDYVNAPVTAGGMDLMLENQSALRGALDHLAPRLKKRVAVVFTQIDQYAELVTGRNSWRDVMREHLPATQIADIYPEINCLGVSAITETELDVSSTGEPFQRPAANFQSLHMENLMFFLTETCKAIKTNQKEVAADEAERQKWKEKKAKSDALCGWSLGITFSGFCLLYVSMQFGILLIFVGCALQVAAEMWFDSETSHRMESSTASSPSTNPPFQGEGILWKFRRQNGNLVGTAIKEIEESAYGSRKHSPTPRPPHQPKKD